jgi:hypothetical protein
MSLNAIHWPLGFACMMVVIAAGCSPATTENNQQTHGEHDSHAGGEATSVLMIRSDPAKPAAGEQTQLSLMIHGADGAMLKDFDVTHEKLAHLIVVREGLDEFAHLHPDVNADGNMSVTYTFPVPGTYRFYLDHKPTGKPAATAQTTIQVAGEAPHAPPLSVTVPGTNRGDGLDADVEIEADQDGKSYRLTFAVKDDQSSAVTDLQPYLGAMGHLVVLSADGEQYVHAHPLDDSAPDGNVGFEVHFPGPGIYKAWGQFQRGGKVFTIPAVVEIVAANHQH